MPKDGWWVARRGSLIALVICAIGLIIDQFTGGNGVWTMFFIAVFTLVLLAELICYIRYGKTISTVYGEYLVKNRARGYRGLALFGLCILLLIVHLGAYSPKQQSPSGEGSD